MKPLNLTKEVEVRIFFRRLVLIVTVVFLITIGFVGCDRRGAKPESKPTEGSKEVAKKVDDEATDGDAHAADAALNPEAVEVVRMGPKAPALFLTAGLAGYTEPCGCTIDITLGGIDRLAGYIADAVPLYDGTAYFDAGDLLFEFESYKASEIPQEKARVDVVVAGMKASNLRATTPGKLDFALGVDYYTSKIAEIGAQILGANLKLKDKALKPFDVYKVGNIDVVVMAVGDPKQYSGIADVSASDAVAAASSVVETLKKQKKIGLPIVLLSQGDLSFTKSLMTAVPEIDFGVVGVRPRMTDQVDAVGRGVTLEPYDQGRYLGILSIIEPKTPITTTDLVLKNARLGSSTELEKFAKRIKHIEESLGKIPPTKSGKPRPIAVNLLKQKKELEAKITELKGQALKVPDDAVSFIWNPVPMDVGLPLSEIVTEKKKAYNASLKKLNMETDREVVPVKSGERYYVGSNQCALCHVSQTDFWEKTAHAHALKTLEERDKAWDQSCIGCHVVGYEKPGGSVLGKLEYEAEIQIGPGSPPQKRLKDLKNVGCESCHGPGSAHVAAPLSSSGRPQNIRRSAFLPNPTPGHRVVCQDCHVPHHSPRFNYETYVKQITGPGHELNSH